MNLQYLESTIPGFSIQDLSHTNILSMPLGKICPVLWEFVHPNESIEIDFDWLCRTMPLNAPLMDNMEIAFDAFWVPARTLGIAGADSVGYNFEKFFNPKSSGDMQLPQLELIHIAETFLARYGRLDGTLYDYLGFPTFPEMFRKIRNYMANWNISNGILDEEYYATGKYSEFDASLLETNALISFLVAFRATNNDLDLLPVTVSTDPAWSSVTISGGSANKTLWDYTSFTAYVINRYLIASGVYDDLDSGEDLITRCVGAINAIKSSDNDVFGFICRYLNTSPAQFYDNWYAWLFRAAYMFEMHADRDPDDYSMFGDYLSSFFEDADSNTGFYAFLPDDLLDEEHSLILFFLYWKVITDWYVNPLLVDGDDNYLAVTDKLIEASFAVPSWSLPYQSTDLANRLYSFDDAFVTCTASGDQPNVLLPANPSVKDIRNMNRLQIRLERIAKAGKRYMDQILAEFGIEPNNARLDRSEVLFRRTEYLDLQTVTQMNQSDFNRLLNSPIGTQFGQSTTFKSFEGNTITFDEHGFYLVMASIRPKASYFQGRNKFFRLLKRDDFLIPDFAQIGDDKVENFEVYADCGAEEGTFGYNQRYYNWMWHPSEVHGLFLNELDYYHLGRRFTSQPQLNETFCSVDAEQNDLNRIFTSYDSTPFLMWLNFKEKMLRPLPTSSTYSL